MADSANFQGHTKVGPNPLITYQCNALDSEFPINFALELNFFTLLRFIWV